LSLSRFFAALFLFVICSALLSSQPLRFERISAEEGLPDATIKCIIQDRLGFLWFGTVRGVCRYDGYSFRVFQEDPRNPQSLSGYLVYTILEDRSGQIWIGTIGGGLNKFDPVRETFTRYRHDPANPNSLSNDDVYALFEDRSGKLWIGTRAGLDLFDRTNQRFTYVNPDIENIADSVGSQVTTIYERPAEPNVLWIGTWKNGVKRYDVGKNTFTHFRNDPNNPFSISHNMIRFIYEAPSSNWILWIGTEGGGLNKFDIKRERFSSYKNDPKDPASLSSDQVRSILEDRSGILWVGTSGPGLNRFDAATGKFFHYFHDPKDNRSLSNSNVSALFEDETGVHWVGTRDGLNRFNPPKENFVIYQHDPADPHSLSNNFLFSLYEDRSGVLWIASSQGLNRFDRATERFTCYSHNPNDPHSLRNNLVSTIYEDSKGTLWVGNFYGVLHRFDRKSGKSKSFKFLNDQRNEKYNDILSILEDRNGTFWVGTVEGLYIFDREKWKCTPVYLGPLVRDRFGLPFVNALYEDKRGTLWIGTGTEGLLAYEQKSGNVVTYMHDPANSRSLSHNNVTFVSEDRSGILWVTTRGGGLNRFDREKNEFTSFTKENGLPDEYLLGFLEDNSGNFWFGAGKFLCRFNPLSGLLRSFDLRHVLQGGGFNTRSFCRSKMGMMYFGGENGLTAFMPDSIRDNTHIPAVILTTVKVLDREIITDTAVAYLKKVVLPHNENFLSFEFAALDFKDQRQNSYAYMLEGLDKDWIYSGTRRYAGYTGLDPGTYIFRVKGSNNNGVWNEAGTSLTVVINPAYWQTWWFRSLAIVLFLSLIGFIYQRDVNRLKKEKLVQQEFSRKQIEQQEAERKRLASELHDGLGQNLLVIKNELQQFLIEKNVSQEDLQRVTSLAQESVESVREISSNLHPHHIERLGFCAAIKAMTENISHASGLRIECSCDTFNHQLPKEKEIHLYRIIQEGLSNIVRHASARNVRVEVRENPKSIEVVINDDGCGFDIREFQGGQLPGQSIDPGRGFGLASMSERARIIGGTLTIESLPSSGTTIRLTLPVS
jgi:signal transduction histidine kinase/ligand-binding sensor domain-containing protein